MSLPLRPESAHPPLTHIGLVHQERSQDRRGVTLNYLDRDVRGLYDIALAIQHVKCSIT